MASKQHIKETINALCKILLQNSGTKITPEQFRLAKFDKNEVAGVMWKLLFETIWFLKFNTFRTTEDFNGDQNRDMILWTKHELLERGYYIKPFYDLPEDMSFGSREILLAFGWLVSKSKLLHLFLDNCNNMFEECLPIDWESSIGSSNSKKSEKFPNNFSNKSDEIINIDQLSWMVGNLTLIFKGLFTAENQLASLVGKVHLATEGADTPKGHLSVLEVFLLRHPKELARFMEKTRQYSTYLENLLTFVEMQDVFWRWLESIYEVKISECNDTESLTWNSKKPCRTCCEIVDERLLGICNIQAEIQRAIDENERQCTATYEQATSDELQSICQTKLQELNKKLQTLTLNEKPQSKHAEVQTFPELKHVNIASGGTKQSGQSSAQQEIDVLNVKLSELELNLIEVRNEHFDILNDLVGNLEDSVFIPPIGNCKYTELRSK